MPLVKGAKAKTKKGFSTNVKREGEGKSKKLKPVKRKSK